MQEETTTAFILKTLPYKENDRLVYAYTKEYGKITLLARGVNKLTSKNRAALQEITLVELTFIPKKGICTLIRASINEFYSLIKEDLTLQIYSSYFMEFFYKLEENEPNESMYCTLKHALDYLMQGYPPKLIYGLFNLRMLKDLGIGLEVNKCARCKEVKPIKTISVYDGGFICYECLQKKEESMDKEILKLFRHFYLLSFERIDEIHYTLKNLDEVVKIIDLFIEEYSGIYFNTKKFIQSLDQ